MEVATLWSLPPPHGLRWWVIGKIKSVLMPHIFTFQWALQLCSRPWLDQLNSLSYLEPRWRAAATWCIVFSCNVVFSCKPNCTSTFQISAHVCPLQAVSQAQGHEWKSTLHPSQGPGEDRDACLYHGARELALASKMKAFRMVPLHHTALLSTPLSQASFHHFTKEGHGVGGVHQWRFSVMITQSRWAFPAYCSEEIF